MRKFKVLLAIALMLSVAGLAYAAVSTDTIHNNNSPGLPINTNDTIFDDDATAQYATGTKIVLSDGRTFRYAHFGEDTSAGELVAQDISESASLSASDSIVVVASASANTVTDGLINNKFVELTFASVTDGQYAGGYLYVTDNAGEGHNYRIRNNTATDDPVSGSVRVELYDQLKVAVTSASEVAILGCKYSNLESADNATDEPVAGVCVSAKDVSAAAYGWVQTSGICSVLVDASGGALTLGGEVAISDGVAGAVQTADVYTEYVLGSAIDVVQDGAHGLIVLNLE